MESNYVIGLMNYINADKRNPFFAMAFSTEERLENYLKEHTLDALLYEESMMPVIVGLPEGKNICTIKLAEQAPDKMEKEALYRYLSVEEILKRVLRIIKAEIGYPVVLRPAYTLGGSGGGIAENEEEFVEILMNGLRLSRVGQVLVERCIAGWKEIEYEVMRDANGTCITVCNMENLDPVGVHTGDSIVVAPSQTLGDKEYQMLRTSALNIISELNIRGGCNVQFALHPTTFEYCVIEVNRKTLLLPTG